MSQLPPTNHLLEKICRWSPKFFLACIALYTFICGILVSSHSPITTTFAAIVWGILFVGLIVFSVTVLYVKYTWNTTVVPLSPIPLIFFIITCYSCIYALLLCYNPTAFVDGNGLGLLEQQSGWWIQMIDIHYFSIVTMTTLGYGDILPNAWYAKLVVSSQAIILPIIVVFILSPGPKVKKRTAITPTKGK